MPVPPRETLAKPDVSAFSPKDIILARIETERLEVIPLDRILTDSALIDGAHANELGNSMKEKRGQITPIAVRARINEKDGEVMYDIIDGFHRTEGKKRTGDTKINATVIYGCSDEEMFDLRILAASSVRSVQFARIAEWITSSFAITLWAEKGLSVSQAFGMVVAGSNRSNLVDMTQEERSGLKEWVNARCTRWGKTPGSVYQDLRVVANADQGLVKEVRMATGGDSRKVRISPMKLALVVNAFPGNPNHALQREILHFAIANKLNIDEIRIIVENLRNKIKPEITEEEIKGLIRKVELEGVMHPSSPMGWKKENLYVHTAGLENDLFNAQERIAALLVDVARLRGNIVNGRKLEGESIALVKKAILVLPSELRTTFILQQEFGYSSYDIAKILNKTENSIAENIRRAWDLIDKSKVVAIPAPKVQHTPKPAKTIGVVDFGVQPPAPTNERNKRYLTKPVASSAATASPKPVEKAIPQATKAEVRPSSGTNGNNQPKETAATPPPTVLFDHGDKGGNHKNPNLSPPLPEHLERKPADFIEEEKVFFLKRQDEDRPGVIKRTLLENGIWYVEIEFPSMRHRDIYGGYTTKIPIVQFDNRYALA